MSEQQRVTEAEKVVLESRKKLSMTGVSSVDGFSEQCLKLTASGNKVTVFGENLKITAFNKNSGNLVAEGVITEFRYNNKKTPLVKKLFK